MIPNADVRCAARMAGVPMWRLAKAMDFSYNTLFRKLREPLTDKQRKQYLDTIHRLSQQNENK